MTVLSAPSPDYVRALTVRTVLERAVTARPEGEALIGRSGRLTFAQLDNAVNRAANALLDLGIGTGDRVAISLPNDLRAAVTLLATGRIGAVWVGINRQLAGPEKAFIVSNSGAEILLADAATVAQLEGFGSTMPDLRSIITCDPTSSHDEWGTRCEASAPDRPTAVVDPLQSAAITYTSGTTGFPKGVVLCHRALLLQGAVFTSTRRMDAHSRFGVWLPLCNVQSLMASILTTAQVGGTSVVIDRADAAAIADWVQRERITHLQSVATILNDLTSNPGITAEMLGTVEDITVGGADVPDALIERFVGLTGVYPSVGYGQTESAGAITMTPFGVAPVPKAVGKPLPHLDVSIVNDSGPLPAYQIGEIRVRPAQSGPWAGLYTPMLEYWERPAESSEVLKDGWLYTGDLGYLSDEAVLFIKGRKVQMILRGGANVYPAEVERVLLDTPGLDAAAVFGLPDDRLGERVVAVVSPQPSHSLKSESCMERCRAHLARYKCPDQILVVDSLPRNALGKVIRAEAIRIFKAATAS